MTEYVTQPQPSQEGMSLYPNLEQATAPPSEIGDEGHAFRLVKIDKIQKEIDIEREKRKTLSKKYHKVIKAVRAVDDFLVVCTMGLGVAGIGVLSTIIAAPVAIGMEAAALGAGLLSIVGSNVTKRLILKAEKHDKIMTIAETKLNTINDYVSRSLMDNYVSEDEYTMILNELEKFNTMREETRSKIRVGLDEATKQSLINQGKEETMKNFQNMFGSVINRRSVRR